MRRADSAFRGLWGSRRAQGRPSLGFHGQGFPAMTTAAATNWVLDGYRTDSGKPLVANDPHIPYYAVSIWHEVRLHGGAFNVTGVALAGMPGVMIGRNEHVAWGITNNICSQRDLYQEKTDAAHPGCFLYDGKWEPAQLRSEVIAVRGQDAARKTIRSSRNGPIVDEVIPAAIRHTGPVSVRWLGFEPCGWLTATIGTNRAKNCKEFREAARPWLCPTFNLVFADTEGNIGFQSVGRIPLRKISGRRLSSRLGSAASMDWRHSLRRHARPHQSQARLRRHREQSPRAERFSLSACRLLELGASLPARPHSATTRSEENLVAQRLSAVATRRAFRPGGRSPCRH